MFPNFTSLLFHRCAGKRLVHEVRAGHTALVIQHAVVRRKENGRKTRPDISTHVRKRGYKITL